MIRGVSEDGPEKGGPGFQPVCWAQLPDRGSYHDGPANDAGRAQPAQCMLGHPGRH